MLESNQAIKVITFLMAVFLVGVAFKMISGGDGKGRLKNSALSYFVNYVKTIAGGVITILSMLLTIKLMLRVLKGGDVDVKLPWYIMAFGIFMGAAIDSLKVYVNMVLPTLGVRKGNSIFRNVISAIFSRRLLYSVLYLALFFISIEASRLELNFKGVEMARKSTVFQANSQAIIDMGEERRSILGRIDRANNNARSRYSAERDKARDELTLLQAQLDGVNYRLKEARGEALNIENNGTVAAANGLPTVLDIPISGQTVNTIIGLLMELIIFILNYEYGMENKDRIFFWKKVHSGRLMTRDQGRAVDVVPILSGNAGGAGVLSPLQGMMSDGKKFATQGGGGTGTKQNVSRGDETKPRETRQDETRKRETQAAFGFKNETRVDATANGDANTFVSRETNEGETREFVPGKSETRSRETVFQNKDVIIPRNLPRKDMAKMIHHNWEKIAPGKKFTTRNASQAMRQVGFKISPASISRGLKGDGGIE